MMKKLILILAVFLPALLFGQITEMDSTIAQATGGTRYQFLKIDSSIVQINKHIDSITSLRSTTDQNYGFISGHNDSIAAHMTLIDVNTGKVTMTYSTAGIPLSTGSAWGTSITNNSANWNTAYGWGDWSTQMNLRAPIADPTFTGEIGIGAVNISETELGILEGATLTTTELNYVDNVTSAIQTQFTAKSNIASPTFTGKVTTAATVTGTAGLNLPHGTAPTSPVNGDVWTTTAGMYVRTNGTTVGPLIDATNTTVGSSIYAPKYPTANNQTGTAYTLVLTDDSKIIRMTNASANVLTVPLNSSVAFTTGTLITIVMGGAGVTSIAATGGVTITSLSSALDLQGAGAYATLRKTGTDTWDLFGAIE